MKTLTLVVAAMALAGCATEPNRILAAGQDKKIDIDERLMQECPALPENVSIKTPEEILPAYANAAKLYGECKRRHQELTGTVRKAFNLDQKPTTTTK